MGSKRERLSEVRQNLLDRYAKIREEVRNYSPSDLIANKCEQRIWKLLQEFGIDYPLDFDRPPPDVYVPARQGTFCLDPQGTTTGSSPPTATDEVCLTWKARSGGFLVIDSLDWIMEDPISEQFLISYKFDQQPNVANFQDNKKTAEPGHWKFNRVVLIDEEVMTVCISNPNPFAGGCVSFESRAWML